MAASNVHERRHRLLLVQANSYRDAVDATCIKDRRAFRAQQRPIRIRTQEMKRIVLDTNKKPCSITICRQSVWVLTISDPELQPIQLFVRLPQMPAPQRRHKRPGRILTAKYVPIVSRPRTAGSYRTQTCAHLQCMPLTAQIRQHRRRTGISGSKAR